MTNPICTPPCTVSASIGLGATPDPTTPTAGVTPISIAGVDAANVARPILTDSLGQQRVIGPVQAMAAAQIASGASLSTAVDLGDLRLVRIATPAAWTAAVLTFQVSYDGATWADLYDESGNEVSYTLVAGKSMRLPITDWLGVRHVKLRSGTSAAPVNQGAARSFVLVAQ